MSYKELGLRGDRRRNAEHQNELLRFGNLIEELSNPSNPDYITTGPKYLNHKQLMDIIESKFSQLYTDHTQPNDEDVRRNQERLAVFKSNLEVMLQVAELALSKLRQRTGARLDK